MTDLEKAEARLPRWMWSCAAVVALAALFRGQARFSGGFALGAIIAILSYYWLHEAVDTLMGAGKSRLPKLLVVKFLIRYPLAIAAVLFFYKTAWLPFGAVLAGFFVPVAGALMEAVLQLREGWSSPSAT